MNPGSKYLALAFTCASLSVAARADAQVNAGGGATTSVNAGGGATTSVNSGAGATAPTTGTATTATSPGATIRTGTTAAPATAGTTTTATPNATSGTGGTGGSIAGGSDTTPLAATLPPPGTVPDVPAVNGARALSLAEAVAIARRDPPTVLAAIARIQAAEAQIPLARAALLPVLSGRVNAQFGAVNGVQTAAGGATNVANISSSLNTNITGNWTIWDFGRTALNVDAAELNARAARLDAASASRLAVSQAAVAYFTALADQELIASASETVRQRERQAQIAHGLVEAGARPPIEQTRSDVALEAARLDLINATVSTQNDIASLASALAIDPLVNVAIQHPREIALDDDPNHAAAEAERTRPEIAAARLAMQRAEVQVAAARAGYRPSITATATAAVALNYNYRFPVQTAMGLAPATETFGPTEQGSAAVGLVVPMYDPVLNANIRIALANMTVARAALAQQVLIARTEAVQAAIQLRAARQALAQSERLAAGAAANLAQAQGRYEAGAAPLLELVDAQAADATARVAVVRARWQFELGKVRLLAAVGHLDALGQQ